MYILFNYNIPHLNLYKKSFFAELFGILAVDFCSIRISKALIPEVLRKLLAAPDPPKSPPPITITITTTTTSTRHTLSAVCVLLLPFYLLCACVCVVLFLLFPFRAFLYFVYVYSIFFYVDPRPPLIRLIRLSFPLLLLLLFALFAALCLANVFLRLLGSRNVRFVFV